MNIVAIGGREKKPQQVQIQQVNYLTRTRQETTGAISRIGLFSKKRLAQIHSFSHISNTFWSFQPIRSCYDSLPPQIGDVIRNDKLISVQRSNVVVDRCEETHTHTLASKLTSASVQTVEGFSSTDSPFEVLFKGIFSLKVGWFRLLNGSDGSS